MSLSSVLRGHTLPEEKGNGKIMTDHPTHIQFINPPSLFTPPGFTHVVEITGGRTVYIAGQTAIDQSLVGLH